MRYWIEYKITAYLLLSDHQHLFRIEQLSLHIYNLIKSQLVRDLHPLRVKD